MAPKSTAKIFMHGRSQAVRLPKEFRLPGKEVTVRKVGNGVLLEPIEKKFDVKAWRAKLDAMGAKNFLPEGRPEQPQWTLDDDVSFD
jgi:antitoxin VapB